MAGEILGDDVGDAVLGADLRLVLPRQVTALEALANGAEPILGLIDPTRA